MNLLVRLFSSFVLLAFGIFLMSPIVAIASEGSDIVITGSSSFDTCSSNITCEQTSDQSYQCHATDAMIAGLGGQVHQISVGKTAPIILSYPRFIQGEKGCLDRGSQIAYIESDTFVYPFVGIIKIQV